MDLTGDVLRDAATFVDAAAGEAELHTVTLELDGASGGVILTIQGTVDDMATDYERKYIVGSASRHGERIA